MKNSTFTRLPAALAIAVALTGCATAPANVRFLNVPGAPQATGPYSQGTVANGFIYTSGFTARDPVTNIATGDITAQTNRVLDSIEAVLKVAGAGWMDVVKMNVYMTNLGEIGKMNDAITARLGNAKPARAAVGVASLTSNSALVIEVVARAR